MNMLQDRSEIRDIYNEIRPRIEARMEEFQGIWEEKDPHRIFKELVFCLFTPQSKARICWETVEELVEKDLLLDGCKEDISDNICRVRFRHNKAGYVVELREKFGPPERTQKLIERLEELPDNKARRRWLVDDIKGMGYKEGSHYLRNIGSGKDLAILDRHILKNLEKFGVIEDIPKSITPAKYLEIEKRMADFAVDIDIPLSHLDFVLWYKETGDIFK